MQEGTRFGRRWRLTALLVLGAMVGMLVVASPAGAHFKMSINHIWHHIKGKADKRYIKKNTLGMPLAGASIAADGTVQRYFNRKGGAPTVDHSSTGIYIVTFPGLDGKAYYNNSVVSVSLQGISGGEIARWSSSGNPYVATSDSTGAASNRAFEIVILVPGGVPGPRPVPARPGAPDDAAADQP